MANDNNGWIRCDELTPEVKDDLILLICMDSKYPELTITALCVIAWRCVSLRLFYN